MMSQCHALRGARRMARRGVGWGGAGVGWGGEGRGGALQQASSSSRAAAGPTQ